MLTASGAFALAQGSLFQRVSGSVNLDLPAGPYVDFSKALRTIQFDDALQTDLPDGIRDIVGFGTKGGSVTFAGSVDPNHDPDKNAYWLFNPDNTTSPLYRLKVKGSGITFDFGQVLYGSLTPEVYRQITGVITSVDIDHDAGTATLGFVDLSGNTSGAWGALPEIPAVVTVAPYNAGLTSEYAMDQIIRAAQGGSSWPAARTGCIVAAGMRSSVWPEVGTLNTTPGLTTPTFGRGVMGTALTGISGTLAYSGVNVPADLGVEGWITNVSHGGVILTPNAGLGIIQVVVTSTGISVEVGGGVFFDTYTWTTPIDDTGHYVGAVITWNAGNWSVQLRLDHTSNTSGARTVGFTRSDTTSVSVQTSTGTGWEGMQAWAQSGAVAWNDTFTPKAVLDASLNPLTVAPAIAAGTAPMDELQKMAAAEFGYFRLDGQGIARFSNRLTLATQAVSRTISSVTSLKSLATSQGANTEYNNVQVPFTEWNYGAATAIYILQTNKLIPGGQTVTWTQPLDDGTLAAAIDTTAVLLPNGHNPLDGGSYYRASADPAGLTAHPGLTVTTATVTPGTVQITAHNGTRIPAYLTTPSTFTDLTAGAVGTGLWIGGIPATAGDEATATATYGDGQSNFAMSSNAYIQFQAVAQGLANWLLCQLFVAIRDFTGVEIVPDARIETGDIDRLQDLIRSGIDEYVYVWGRSFTAEFPAPGESGGTWGMTLNVRALGPPGAWLAGIAGRSEIGTTAYAYS